MNAFAKRFFAVVFLLTTACKSQSFENSVLLNNSLAAREPFYSWHLQCLDKSSGKIGLTFELESKLQFSIQGVWSANFKSFQATVQNQQGQSVGDINATDDKTAVSLSTEIKALAIAKQLESFLQTLVSTGAMGFRRLSCGVIGYSEVGTKSMATKPALTNEHLFSSVLRHGDQAFELLSLYDVQDNETKANFHFHPQGQSAAEDFDIEWTGKTNPLRPNELKMTRNGIHTVLTVNDFS